ncbi:HAD family hydrolase [Vibrio cholerae]|uniref:HAD family hydrolase n=1 Tax=Vibrio cholerae TaxID=666 RepID=UPI00215CF191|nr:HAD family hydrolase [Vibrio cholerae]ELJ8486933.1 HAD family hydrolase [Vibrio cholerae]MCR9709134.1 HAD hydrolase-like protein [Vibrio cholerae]HDL9486875.1 HAD family hydrolase [Vibrio cholerae]
MNLTQYQTLVFDCDGVVLNSNKVKTDAFFKAALPYGEAAAHKLVDYHVSRGGISRYKKFEWFVQQVVVGKSGPDLSQLLEAYANEVRHGLLTCEIASGLAELRANTQHCNWLIVSGGDQQELREVFAERGIAELFDGGIFGSPDSKESILDRELATENIKQPALFLGDSKYDYQAAQTAGLDFIFLSQWSEVKDYQTWCELLGLKIELNVKELV